MCLPDILRTLLRLLDSEITLRAGRLAFHRTRWLRVLPVLAVFPPFRPQRTRCHSRPGGLLPFDEGSSMSNVWSDNIDSGDRRFERWSGTFIIAIYIFSFFLWIHCDLKVLSFERCTCITRNFLLLISNFLGRTKCVVVPNFYPIIHLYRHMIYFKSMSRIVYIIVPQVRLMSPRRKRVMLTIAIKYEITVVLENAASLVKKYGIGKSTITDIK